MKDLIGFVVEAVTSIEAIYINLKLKKRKIHSCWFDNFHSFVHKVVSIVKPMFESLINLINDLILCKIVLELDLILPTSSNKA